MSWEKRGQLTAFVIVGIIVVAAILIVIAINRATFSSILKEGEVESIAVPEKIAPLRDQLETCFKETINEGISLLSLQGGFIDFEEDLIPRGPVNPFSNSLNVFDNNLPVAYWFYEKVNGIKTLNIPTLASMQQQLENYIDINSRKCLNYDNFEALGFIINEGNIISNLKINDNSVSALINYPLSVTLRDLNFKFDKFNFEIKSDLGKLYRSSIEILQAENKILYLENKTLDFIAVYDEVPYYDVDLNCNPKSYLKKNIETGMKNILATNIPLIKVKGNFIIDRNLFFSEAEVDDIDVNFNYNPDWPMQFDVVSNPNDAVLRGDPYTTENQMSQFLMPIFCLNTYNFVYSIKYPVLISLTSGLDAFQFATQVIIDHNQPREATILPDIELEEDSPICTNPTSSIKVNTLADLNNNYVPLNDARVSLQCVNALCKLGSSDLSGSLSANVPGCVNAVLTAEREGYFKASEQLSTVSSQEVSLVLEPIRELDFEARVMDDNARNLGKNELAFIQFEDQEKGYSTSLVYPGASKINLIQGTYTVKSYLLLNSTSGIAINDQKVRVCNDVPKEGLVGVVGLTEKKCFEQKIEGTTLESVISGGNEFELTISPQDLMNKKLIFYIKSIDVPTNYNQLTKANEKIKKNEVTLPVFTNE